ncbi:hypothetical protein TTHERM_000571827 (macronuclear) [Tetrahymena thermophila SB210]|uniref:Uncharacterized protein n=1 Tax=Tetrahymena thermophila (strain SB210) TaxID=312017 RepID=W7WZE9_TETTS|nr:hypothetical protein TTHERM_000571827 [Tetrahymena thermophila SB210]EWS72275.1 hypothetical protein TTHERM_000571827 [Tetrahymena thermophila SB210]|eukprot:XP_012655215.1 hypothetical protein TTHERM_000571827 [Tetrahymena thermophila SB210]
MRSNFFPLFIIHFHQKSIKFHRNFILESISPQDYSPLSSLLLSCTKDPYASTAKYRRSTLRIDLLQALQIIIMKLISIIKTKIYQNEIQPTKFDYKYILLEYINNLKIKKVIFLLTIKTKQLKQIQILVYIFIQQFKEQKYQICSKLVDIYKENKKQNSNSIQRNTNMFLQFYFLKFIKVILD